jgi:hypothetical protein
MGWQSFARSSPASIELVPAQPPISSRCSCELLRLHRLRKTSGAHHEAERFFRHFFAVKIDAFPLWHR